MSKWSYTRGADRGNKLSDENRGVPRDRDELRKQTAHWAAQFHARRKAEAKRQRQVPANIVITAGMKPDGTLKVHIFKSAAEAHKAGFTWAGRPSTA